MAIVVIVHTSPFLILHPDPTRSDPIPSPTPVTIIVKAARESTSAIPLGSKPWVSFASTVIRAPVA